MPLSPGDKLGSYEIVALIGTGGMGEVYRARDARLGRDIAVKVLPAGLAQDPERLARFQREARAVAALNHPHIVTIYSVEESGGSNFLTMELVEGEPLDRLIGAGGLPVDQIVEIAGALADALAAAHDKGIIHRDLKPANIMVTHEGRVKVLDFGLAKDVRAAGPEDATIAASRTKAGMVMGTPAYMSPEQIAGRSIDHRTDIFSLGVVLHEMSTGTQPFAGDSSAELMSAILRDTPTPAAEIRAELPGDLARIIRRCLEKDPRHRVQTARDVANEFRDMVRQMPRKAPAAGAPLRAVVAANSGAARADEGFWVAVLPFQYTGANADIAELAAGMTEDIVTGMSRFSYLRVIGRSAISRYAHQPVEVTSAAKELGARYVMEGTIRQAGTRLRIAVQLVDTNTGAHLWAENYLRPLNPEALFELQDELVPRIVSTVADARGVLPQSMSESLRSRTPDQLTPYEAALRGFAYLQRLTEEEHAIARASLERALEREPGRVPGHADALGMLANLYREEYIQGYNQLPDPLGRSLAAAQEAIAAAPSNQSAHVALASVLFFRREIHAFRSVAERAIALNPMDGSNLAYLGTFLAYSGDWERGCALTERARNLNPHFPGWYWFASLWDAYRKGDYRAALDVALKINLPGFWRAHVALAACYGKLGEPEAARDALRDLLAARPNFASIARQEFEKQLPLELVEDLIDGLRKAGLEMAPKVGAAATEQKSGNSSVVKDSSGTKRADEGFWVAVLPFKSTGDNSDLTALADGLTEDIVTGMSRFSYLRVIGRSATSRYAHQPVEVTSAAKELGARYVMEGTIRQAGTRLRIAVQLVDAHTGAHLWAENYLRPLNPEALFELQDELVPRIVSTVADSRGVLPQSMSESLRSRTPDQLTPYEAVLRSFSYQTRLSAEEHAIARTSLERALEREPETTPVHADAWAMLSVLYRDEYQLSYNLLPDPLGRALAAAQRAMEASPSSQLACTALAMVRFFRREFQAFREMAERAIALNPFDGITVAILGNFIAYSGEWERGCALSEQARNLNPHYPGWYWFGPMYNAYRLGDYRAALDFALKINLPGYWRAHQALAAIYGQLGELEAARGALRELLLLRPDFAAIARQELGKTWMPDLTEHVLDGLRKAGLEVPDDK